MRCMIQIKEVAKYVRYKNIVQYEELKEAIFTIVGSLTDPSSKVYRESSLGGYHYSLSKW